MQCGNTVYACLSGIFSDKHLKESSYSENCIIGNKWAKIINKK
jgi:hypothetical protein